jgi:hypothetical protein
MSFFSGILGGGGAGNLLGTVLQVGGQVAGGIIASNANKKAAERAAAASQGQAKARQKGLAQAGDEFESVAGETAIAPTYLRRVVAGSNTLQPWQRQGLEDARRDAMRSVSTSGLRGSGRAVTAALTKVDSDLRNKFLESNQARSDRAASELAQPHFNARSRLAATYADTGEALGEGIYEAGMNKAASGLATAQQVGNTIGDVGSVIAGELKPRPSRYTPDWDAYYRSMG